MEYRTRKPAKFDVIIDAGAHPTFLLQEASHGPDFSQLASLLEDDPKFLDEAYERIWIEATRGGVIVGYAILDLYRITDLSHLRHGIKLLQVNADIENIKAGNSGAIREIEVANYDHEALAEMKKAIDILLWRNGIELGM